MKRLRRKSSEGRPLLRDCCEGRRGEAGFTLVEVTVAVAVGPVVIGLAYGAYWGTQRFGARWEDRLKAQNALHVMLRRFSADVRAAEYVAGFSVSSLDLVMAPGVMTQDSMARGHVAEGSAVRGRTPLYPVAREDKIAKG